MRRAPTTLAALLVGPLGALLVSTSAHGARNSAGTYSLPLSPVTSGTSITSTWANTTLADITTELTNSLDRQGRGAMAAPLQCSAGTVAAPGLTFSGDSDTGLYRIGANNPAVTAGGVRAQEWASTGSSVYAGGIKIQEWTSTGSSMLGATTLTDGSVSAPSLAFTADTNTGLYRLNTDSPAIAAGGVSIQDWTSSKANINGGGGTLALKPATADHVYLELYARTSTPAVRSAFVGYANAGSTELALVNELTNGSVRLAPNGTGQVLAGTPINMGGGANPLANTGFSNTLTVANVPKAWVRLVTGTSFAIQGGFNVASVTAPDANTLRVTFATAMANANYAAVVTTSSTSIGRVSAQTTAYFDVKVHTPTVADVILTSGGAFNISAIVMGAQ